jgi:hypothetical protein
MFRSLSWLVLLTSYTYSFFICLVSSLLLTYLLFTFQRCCKWPFSANFQYGHVGSWLAPLAASRTIAGADIDTIGRKKFQLNPDQEKFLVKSLLIPVFQLLPELVSGPEQPGHDGVVVQIQHGSDLFATETANNLQD